jgi:6-phosphogluconolactonase
MQKQSAGKEILVYIGTYTRGRKQGIYLYRMNPATGALRFAGAASAGENPSFLAIDPKGRRLYAVGEIAGFAGAPGGAVSALSLDPQTGKLTLLNQQPSGGAGPCYVTVDAAGRFVLVANYGAGSVSVLPIQEEGRLGAPTDTVPHQGSSVHPARQKGPHAHCIVLDPAGRYAFAADLGLDKILIYQLDPARGKLRPGDPPWAEVKPGAGPRHLAFHPSGRYAYVINEIDNTITAFAYNGAHGTLRAVQTAPALPEGFAGKSHCADIHISPAGKFLYGSNRGHDSIVIFGIDERTGKLAYVGHEPTRGKTPRNFAIDPTGTFLLAANQDSDTIVSFRMDRQTGRLLPTGHVAEVPKPVCIKMLPVTG